ncbi:MAG: GTP 3',8-cyclase MoaA, partial [Dehalococcoidia bacterium]
IERMAEHHEIEPVEPNYRGEVARRWKYADGGGELGFITSISEPFCGDCSRTRLSAEGEMYTCLFGSSGLDLRAPLREGASDAELHKLISNAWRRRSDRYSEIRASHTRDLPRIEMSRIGG